MRRVAQIRILRLAMPLLVVAALVLLAEILVPFSVITAQPPTGLASARASARAQSGKRPDRVAFVRQNEGADDALPQIALLHLKGGRMCRHDDGGPGGS